MKQAGNTFPYHAAMSLTAVIYGVNYFTMKWIFDLGHIHPLGVLAMRSLFSSTVFFILYILFFREGIHSLRDFFLIGLCALTGVVINQAMFISGVKHTTLVNAAVLQTMSPVFVFLTAWLAGQEHMRKRKIGGLILSLTGSALLVGVNSGWKISFGSDTFKGDVMILINGAVYGVYLVISKPLYLRYNIFSFQALTFLMAACINVPLGWNHVQEVDFHSLPWQAWFGLIYFFVFSTVMAYLLYAWALKHLEASSVSMYIYFQPVFVALLSAIFATGNVTREKILYIAIVLCGVYLVTSGKSSTPKEMTEEQHAKTP